MSDEPPTLDYGNPRPHRPWTDHLVFAAVGVGFGSIFLGFLLWWFLARG